MLHLTHQNDVQSDFKKMDIHQQSQKHAKGVIIGEQNCNNQKLLDDSEQNLKQGKVKLQILQLSYRGGQVRFNDVDKYRYIKITNFLSCVIYNDPVRNILSFTAFFFLSLTAV